MTVPSCLVDTNILLRVARRADPHHSLVDTALGVLLATGTRLYYAHKNIAELWNVMTRPVTRSGTAAFIPPASVSGRSSRMVAALY